MEDKDVILEAMCKAGEPLNAGKVAELTIMKKISLVPSMRSMRFENNMHSRARSCLLSHASHPPISSPKT